MPPVYYYREPDEDTTPVPTLLDNDRIRLYTLDVTMNAEEGSVATSTVAIDDPDGDLDIVGHRIFAVKETLASSSNSFIYVGYTAERNIGRGPNRVLTGRQWDTQLVDINTVLERRVMTGSDCNRPAETDVQRVQWLEATNEGHLISDTRYLSTANPVNMDAVDYRGQTFKSILDDCAQSSGKDYWLTFFEDTGATAKYPWGVFGLWYGFRTSTAYASDIWLSNDLADVDGVTVFAISAEDTTLKRDPSRVYSGVYMPYDGGATYAQNNATALAFARRDAISPAENVKSNAKATARAIRYLNDIDTEEDIITTTFQVPAAQVNALRQGQRVRVKATHLPGYETFQWMRVLNRNVKQDSELTYRIRVELGTGGTAAPAYACTPNGYLLPTCTGGLGEAIPTLPISLSSPIIGGAGARGELTVDGVTVYNGATYHFKYTAVHATTNFECNLDLWMAGGTFGSANMGNFPPQPGPSPITEYEFTFAMPGVSGSSCVYATIYEGAGYAGCNNIGASGTLTVTYVSGPDPRFVGLPACP